MKKIMLFKNRKIYLILYFALFSIQVIAQKSEKFYNYQGWECKFTEAHFYSITQKIDSGYLHQAYFVRGGKLLNSLVCKDSLCKIKNGELIRFYPNGKLETTGKYKLNKKGGIWLSYHYNGKMKDSAFYNNGYPLGNSLSWHPNGFLQDSIYNYPNKGGVKVSWFDNGNPDCLGRFLAGNKKSGKWNFFHKNGKVSAVEIYSGSKLIESKYYDENGIEVGKSTKDASAAFPKGDQAWINYLNNYINRFFPNGFDIVNAEKVTIVANFTIDENGKTENIYIATPIDDKIDSLVIKAIQSSPQWIPATNHNRKIKQNNRQTLTFGNENKSREENKATNKGDEFYKYIAERIVIPSDPNFIGGRVVVEFVVQRDGSLRVDRVNNDLGFGMSEQLTKIFENSKRWNPGVKDGIPVEVKYSMPLTINRKRN